MRYEQEISHCSYVVPVKFIFPAFCLQLFFFLSESMHFSDTKNRRIYRGKFKVLAICDL